MRTIFHLLITFLVTIKFSFGQCPTDETDLANGGTFSGNCTIAVGGIINITGTVNWNGGDITITGNNGDINISGTFNLNSGTLTTNDGNDGSLTIASGGSLNIAAGTTVTVDDEIGVQNGASIDVSGSLIRDNQASGNNVYSSLYILSGGIVTVNSGGVIDVDNGDVWDIVNVEGTLNSSGTISSTDFIIDGGEATIQNGGVVNASDNLQVYNGGVLNIEYGADFNVGDDAYNYDGFQDPGFGTASQGTINVYGTLDVANDLVIANTSPDSGIYGGGSISAGDYIDNECNTNGDFCTCANTGNPVAGCSGSGTLPVTWLDFSVHQVNSREALLEWQTSSETNNDGFYIEKSHNDAEFETIGFVSGMGNKQSVTAYSYSDDEINFGTSYYRLRQVDFDGTYDYSKVIYLIVDEINEFNPISIYPNPSSGYINIKGLKEEKYDVNIQSLTGQSIVALTDIPSIDLAMVINSYLPDLKKGAYHIKFMTVHFVQTSKFILK